MGDNIHSMGEVENITEITKAEPTVLPSMTKLCKELNAIGLKINEGQIGYNYGQLQPEMAVRIIKQYPICKNCPGLENCEYEGTYPWYKDGRMLYIECRRAYSHSMVKKVENLLESAKLPKDLKSKELNEMDMSGMSQRQRDQLLSAITTAKKMIHGRVRGIVLSGKPGLGKTHIAEGLVYEYMKHGKVPVFVNVPMFLNDLKRSFNKNSDEGVKRKDVMDLVRKADVVILDDLGSENISSRNGWVQEQLFVIINYCDMNDIQLVITTNFESPSELGDHLSSKKEQDATRILSRIAGRCQWIKLDGNDYRMRKAKS